MAQQPDFTVKAAIPCSPHLSTHTLVVHLELSPLVRAPGIDGARPQPAALLPRPQGHGERPRLQPEWAAGGLRRSGRLRDGLASQQLRAFRFVGHGGAVLSCAVAPSGNLSSARRTAPCARGCPVKGSRRRSRLHGSVRSVDFSSDGQQLLTASDDKTLKAWSIPGSASSSPFWPLNWVRCAKFSPDDRLVLSSGDDKSVRLWDVRSHAVIHTFHDHLPSSALARSTPTAWPSHPAPLT